jgi:hypothetical protein
MRSILMAAVAVAALAPMAAHADSISGTSNGLTWTAQNNVIGQTSTATIAGGGNPIYTAPMPQYSGVVALIMNEGAAGNFICSGSLLPDRMSILTAGHCVSHGAGTANPITTTAYFYGGPNPDTVVPGSPDATPITISRYTVNSAYTGQVVDQNDIAILRLSTAAPDFASSYGIDTAGDLTGQNFNFAGYGVRSDVGGALGADLGTGRLRQGDNTYDFRLGDADFGGTFDPNFFGTAADQFDYLSDFDNGKTANDASCQLAVLSPGGFGLTGAAAQAKYCNTGVGALEASTGGGDSGGPQFINGQIASITGFGLTFGPVFGDIDNKLDDSFGEFNGFIPTFIHAGFIADAQAVPEPASWALMITGFGLVGAATRRQRRRAAATA